MTLEKTFPRTVLLNKWCLLFTLFLAFLLAMPSTKAAATLEVVAFSCNPDEVVINNQFSCVVTVQNTGDATGTLNTATLYPDATNWLEEISYAETANVNIDSGASAEVVFNGLKGKKSGDNGFSKIMLDDVTDTYVADNAITLNVIDIVVTTSASTSSANSGGTVDVTAQTVVGGNVDVTLTFSVVSGGCSIGDQVASATTNNVARGQTISHTWTVTLGSDDCNYMVTAKASTNPSKTDSSSGSISCSNCGGGSGSSSSSSSSSGGGGGGGGGSSTETQKTKCNDNFDNDNDGLVDLKDPGCE